MEKPGYYYPGSLFPEWLSPRVPEAVVQVAGEERTSTAWYNSVTSVMGINSYSLIGFNSLDSAPQDGNRGWYSMPDQEPLGKEVMGFRAHKALLLP